MSKKKLLAWVLLSTVVTAGTVFAEETPVTSGDHAVVEKAVSENAQPAEGAQSADAPLPVAEVEKAPVVTALELWLEGKDEEAFAVCEKHPDDVQVQKNYFIFLTTGNKLYEALKVMRKTKALAGETAEEVFIGEYEEKLMQAAISGNARAELLMGMREDDKKKSLDWYRKSANKGNAAAAYFLGGAYKYGEGTKKDLKEAFKWFKRSADSSFSQGLLELGWAYDYGDGVKKDPKAAYNCYLKGAQINDFECMYEVGKCFYYGSGVKKDLAEAAKWYRKAAELDEENAQYDLAMMYHLGKGVPRDAAEAKKWAKLAAENKHEKAQALYDAIVESEKYMTVTAKKMLNDLNNNALAANDDYLGKYVKVSGILSTIDSRGKYIVVGQGGLTITGLHCAIRTKEQRDHVKKLKRNQKITVLGKVTRVGELAGYWIDLDAIK